MAFGWLVIVIFFVITDTIHQNQHLIFFKFVILRKIIVFNIDKLSIFLNMVTDFTLNVTAILGLNECLIHISSFTFCRDELRLLNQRISFDLVIKFSYQIKHGRWLIVRSTFLLILLLVGM